MQNFNDNPEVSAMSFNKVTFHMKIIFLQSCDGRISYYNIYCELVKIKITLLKGRPKSCSESQTDYCSMLTSWDIFSFISSFTMCTIVIYDSHKNLSTWFFDRCHHIFNN